MTSRRGDKHREIQFLRQPLQTVYMIGMLVSDEDRGNFFGALPEGLEAFKGLAARESGVDQDASRTGRNESAISTTAARQYRHRHTHGRSLRRAAVETGRDFQGPVPLMRLPCIDSSLFRLLQGASLIGKQQHALGTGVRLKTRQMTASVRRARPQLDLSQGKPGLIVIDAVTKLARGSRHRFQFPVSLSSPARFRFYARVCQSGLEQWRLTSSLARERDGRGRRSARLL